MTTTEIRTRHTTHYTQWPHASLPIKQVYGRCYNNHGIIIVSKNWLQRQLPGGKPEPHETPLLTLIREIQEETWLLIKSKEKQFLWYYCIKERWEEYLQLRYACILENRDYHIQPAPKDSVIMGKLCAYSDLITHIPRLPDSEEYKTFMLIAHHS